MGVTWSGCYIPSDEQHPTPTGAIERIVTQFAALATPSSPVADTLDGKGRIIFLQLTEEGRDGASTWLFDEGEVYPMSIMVEEYGVPQPELDHAGQRVCGSCGALVPTWAVCERCGVEEDPRQWTIGPPVALFSRSVAVSVLLEGGPDVVTLAHAELDRRLRGFLGGRVEAIESMLGCSLKLVPHVLT